jgi:hypothetical protein
MAMYAAELDRTALSLVAMAEARLRLAAADWAVEPDGRTSSATRAMHGPPLEALRTSEPLAAAQYRWIADSLAPTASWRLRRACRWQVQPMAPGSPEIGDPALLGWRPVRGRRLPPVTPDAEERRLVALFAPLRQLVRTRAEGSVRRSRRRSCGGASQGILTPALPSSDYAMRREPQPECGDQERRQDV